MTAFLSPKLCVLLASARSQRTPFAVNFGKNDELIRMLERHGIVPYATLRD
jgi:hypothetical protein